MRPKSRAPPVKQLASSNQQCSTQSTGNSVAGVAKLRHGSLAKTEHLVLYYSIGAMYFSRICKVEHEEQDYDWRNRVQEFRSGLEGPRRGKRGFDRWMSQMCGSGNAETVDGHWLRKIRVYCKARLPSNWHIGNN